MKIFDKGFPYSLNISKNAEFSKAILLFTSGYIFCYMFLLDYSQEGMNIFFRWSTTSYSQFRHPVLFAIWVTLCGFSFFLNLDHLRRKYNAPQKSIAALQYIGIIAAYTMLFIPTHQAPHHTFSHYFHYYGHLFSAIFYAISNMFCLFGVIIVMKKQDKRFNIWFYGYLIYIVSVIAFFIVKLCGFIETVPTLIAYAALYVLNYTSLMDPLPKNKNLNKQGSGKQKHKAKK